MKLTLTLVIAIVLGLTGCGSDPALTAITITPATATISLGQTVQLKAIGTFHKTNQSIRTDDITGSVTWTSSNRAIATVNSSGLVTSVSPGTVTITATGGGEFVGVVASATVTVSGAPGQSASRDLQSITLIPGSSTLLTVGATTQFQAIGNYNLTPLTQDLTTTATWVSSNSGVATVSNAGLATAIAAGSTTITVKATGVNGAVVTATGTLTVNGTTAPTRDLISITIIPASQEVQNTGEQAQFVAIGNFNNTPTTVDMTNTVQWSSSDAKVATISATGLATVTGGGTATIVAKATAPASGATISATAGIINPNNGSVVLPQLTVYKLGNISAGIITTTPGPISCGNICTGGYPLHSTVTLTASPAAGHTFVGFSANCTVISPISCTVQMDSNETVAAEFN